MELKLVLSHAWRGNPNLHAGNESTATALAFSFAVCTTFVHLVPGNQPACVFQDWFLCLGFSM